MTRLSHRCLALAALALALPAAMPLVAQDNPGSFSLPPGAPAAAPTSAGPADERGSAVIPPQGAPASTSTVTAQPAPSVTSTPRPTAPTATRSPTPEVPASAPSAAATPEAFPIPEVTAAPAPAASGAASPVASAPVLPVGTAEESPAQPEWWPNPVRGLAALAALCAGLLAWRRRKPKVLRLAAPVAASSGKAEALGEAQLDLTLEITAATRSLMRFSLAYRLTIANRSDRAVLDASVAAQIACARASAGQGPSTGAAQGLGTIARIGPHQAQSITGEVHLPLAAIQALRQGTTPLFVPLVHVTLEGEGVRALTRTFVVGPRSASGRVHPISLEGRPGGIAGLVAQPVALPGDPAAAA